MKFLFLCKRYYTNQDLISNQFGRLFHFPVQLINNGHQGIVIAANYRSKTLDYHKIAGVDFYSVPFLLKWPFSFLQQTLKHFKAYKPDILIASGDIHFGVLGLWLAKMAKIPFVYDVYDQYAAFGSGKLPGMKSLYYQTLRKANLVLCASLPLTHFAKKFNLSVVFLSNGVDHNLFKPMNKKNVRNQLGFPENAVIIGYFGSTESNRSVETLISACQILRHRYPNLTLLMAGKLSIPLNEVWIDHRGMVTQQEVAQFINASDVVVIPYLPETLINMGNSCKTVEYLACEAPIVTTRVDNFMANYANISATITQGICEPLNHEDMARAISAQIETPQVAEFDNELTWEQLGKKLSQALLTII